MVVRPARRSARVHRHQIRNTPVLWPKTPQFTPKTVEISDEREKLMFRVKLKVDAKALKEYSRRVKTGVRGLGIVRTIAATAWPQAAVAMDAPHDQAAQVKKEPGRAVFAGFVPASERMPPNAA